VLNYSVKLDFVLTTALLERISLACSPFLESVVLR
jgi:hypothetical protein